MENLSLSNITKWYSDNAKQTLNSFSITSHQNIDREKNTAWCMNKHKPMTETDPSNKSKMTNEIWSLNGRKSGILQLCVNNLKWFMFHTQVLDCYFNWWQAMTKWSLSLVVRIWFFRLSFETNATKSIFFIHIAATH